MRWCDPLGALLGEAADGRRLGVRIRDLTLLWTDADQGLLDEFPLDGRSRDDAVAWLDRLLGSKAGSLTLQTPYELPEHAVARGEHFRRDDGAALEELGRWFGNADHALRRVTERHAEAGPIRCWPHHLDIATLLHVAGDPGSEEARTIGVGLSPGDESHPEPYLYVTPWPYPSTTAWPELPLGAWHVEGFVAAILTGTELIEAASADEQQRRTDGFLAAAIAGCRTLLTEGAR
jgi:hypothetical protein